MAGEHDQHIITNFQLEMKTHRGVKVLKWRISNARECLQDDTLLSWRHSLAFDCVLYERDLRGGGRVTRSAYNNELSAGIEVEMTDFRGV